MPKPNSGNVGTGVAEVGAAGVTLLLGAEAALAPSALVAITLSV